MLHPSESRLARFADDALSPDRRARVASHLAGCARCREAVAEFQALNASLASLPVRPVAASVFEEVLERRARGERVLLPAADPAPARPWGTFVARAAMVLIVLLGAGLATVSRTRDLTAAASDLRMYPEKPLPGAEIRVEYRPGSVLAREPELVLRGRLRTRHHEAYNRELRQTVLARLQRDAEGVFRGTFILPDSVVYATLAVENRAASEIDTNLRAGWAVMAHAADGRPLPDALAQRMHDHMGRSWETAHETSVRMTELYPESPRSWRMAAWYASQLGQNRDSVLQPFRARLAALDARAAAGEPSPDDISALRYALQELGETARASYWRARLIARWPAHPGAVHTRVDELFARYMRKELTREGVYGKLERMWPEAGAVHDAPADLALAFLSRTDSAARILRWVDRSRVRHPARDGAETLLRFPELRDEGLRRLRARIAHMRAFPDGERALFHTREQFRASASADIRAAYAALGTALVEGGNRRGGLDTLALAVAGGWEPRTFRTVADLRLSVGDTAGALPLLARVAADPATSPAFADSALRRLGGKVGADQWRAALGGAREEMQRGVLAGSVSRALPEIRLTGPDSTVRALAQIASGRPTVVVFWSRSCGPALLALPEITRLARRNTHVVLVTEELPSAAFRDYWKSHPGAPPIWHDTRREARRAFSSFGTPQYFVLDAGGRLRFELTSLEEIPRQLAALN